MARPFPYTYIACPGASTTPSTDPTETPSPLDASDPDSYEERTFDPRSPRSNFSLLVIFERSSRRWPTLRPPNSPEEIHHQRASLFHHCRQGLLTRIRSLPSRGLFRHLPNSRHCDLSTNPRSPQRPPQLRIHWVVLVPLITLLTTLQAR
jgi:hypothetical protein